jgi:hypothetical protein
MMGMTGWTGTRWNLVGNVNRKFDIQMRVSSANHHRGPQARLWLHDTSPDIRLQPYPHAPAAVACSRRGVNIRVSRELATNLHSWLRVESNTGTPGARARPRTDLALRAKAPISRSSKVRPCGSCLRSPVSGSGTDKESHACSSPARASRIGQSAPRPCPGHCAMSVASPSRRRSKSAMRASMTRT